MISAWPSAACPCEAGKYGPLGTGCVWPTGAPTRSHVGSTESWSSVRREISSISPRLHPECRWCCSASDADSPSSRATAARAPLTASEDGGARAGASTKHC
eukprot:14116379-Alexandrium_andersonii.AAC.2